MLSPGATRLLLMLIRSLVPCAGPLRGPVCILPKWGVGEDKDITLPPTRGQVLQSSPVGHLHARRRVDAPCVTINHEVVFTTQAFLLSILFSLSRVHLLGELAMHSGVPFPLCAFRRQAMNSS